MAGSSGKKKGSPEYEAVHARIALVALDLITATGVAGCDIRSIAETAGVSTATVRSHYPGGKEQILIAAAAAMPTFAAADPLKGTPAERIDAWIGTNMRYAPRISTLVAEATLHGEEFPAFADAVRRVVHDRRQSIQEFLDRLGKVARPGVSADVLLWLSLGTVQDEVLGGGVSKTARRKLLREAACRLILG